MKKEKVINNADKIADKISALQIDGVIAVSDDGSVCLKIAGKKKAIVWDRCKAVEAGLSKVNISRIGDGVQEGDLWVNADDIDFHGEFSEALGMF